MLSKRPILALHGPVARAYHDADTQSGNPVITHYRDFPELQRGETELVRSNRCGCVGTGNRR